MPMDEIIGYEALWSSMQKCKRGVLWKDSVANFVLNGAKEVGRLSDELRCGTYKERPHKYFEITAPKKRQIMSISFRDRVYQRSLNDVAIYPEMIKHFVYDNTACQKGKGTDFARRRLECHLQRFYRQHGRNGYALKIDVKGYYPNMRHDAVKRKFGRYLEPDVLQAASKILDGFPGEIGFNPGSQIIQIAGISLLDDLDHFIKERLRVKHYLRYMDDMLLISDSKEDLEAYKQIISEKLAQIGFSMHPEKTVILPLTKEIEFLGFRYKLTETGRIVKNLDPNRARAERKKLTRLVRLAKSGKITREKVDQCYASWRAHASKGNTWHLMQKMDKYYRSLWG